MNAMKKMYQNLISFFGGKVALIIGITTGTVLVIGSFAAIVYLEIAFLRLFMEVSFTEGLFWLTAAFISCYTTKIFYKNNSVEEFVIQALIYTAVLFYAFGIAGIFLSVLINVVGTVSYFATKACFNIKEYAFVVTEKPEYRFW